MRTVSCTLIIWAAFALPSGRAAADQASAHLHKAMAHKKEGKADEAIAELKKALEQREAYAAAHHSLGMLYREKGELPKAIQHLERAAQLEPKSAMLHYSLGITYFKADRKQDALRSLTEAARLDPKDVQVQAQLGVLLIRTDPQKAIPYLEAAVKLKPDHPDYAHQLGLAYRRTSANLTAPAQAKQRDDYLRRAERYFLKAAEKKESAELEFDLGALYRRLDKVDEAIKHYEKAIQLKPKMAAAHWDLGHMYVKAKRNDEAIESYKQYLKLAGEGAKDADIAKKRIKELKGSKKK